MKLKSKNNHFEMKDLAIDLLKECQLKAKTNNASPQESATLTAAATIAAAILVHAGVKNLK